MLIECELCGVHVSVKPLYRVNEYGVPAVMRCEDCMDDEPPAETKELVDTFDRWRDTGGESDG